MKEFIVTTFLVLGMIFVAHNFIDNQTANIVEAMPTEGGELVEPTPEPLCDNFNEVEDFEKPIPVVWTAKMDGCLVSCEGASFTRVPEDEKYPRFAGYYPGGLGPWLYKNVLKISGDWIGVDADHPYTVFDNKCVPVIQINKMEIL
ncbi:MAG: hypothetical protein HYT67_01840 [Candidatus Yanofskybacteria bacterium]|nr:hypothetical protein [Candidatus Yanofskybacteria bacterium]